MLAAYQAIDKSANQEVLLPPLTAPNDPILLEIRRKKQLEAEKKKFDYQKKHAEATIAKYSMERSGAETRKKAVVTELNGMKIVDHPIEVPDEIPADQITHPMLDVVPRICHSYLDS
jgi:hypothetical protein